ncbi:MAG: diguanylate cyclase [Candidatus Izemoplasma sp.]
MLSNLSIKNKLFVTFSILSVLIIITSISFLVIVGRLKENNSNLYEHPYTVIQSVYEIESDVRYLYSITEELTETTDPVLINNLLSDMEDLELEIVNHIDILYQQYLGDIQDVVNIENSFKISNDNRDTVIAITLNEDFEEAFEYRNTIIKDQTNEFVDELNVVEDFAKAKAIEYLEEAEQNELIYNITVYISVGVLIAISILLFIMLIKDIIPPLEKILTTIENQGEGENVLELKRKDDLGVISRNLNNMLINMKTNQEIKELNMKLANLKDKENLRITLMSIGDGVITTDLNGVVTNINPVASILTGYPPIEAIGKKSTEIFKIINKMTRDTVTDPISKVIKEGKIVGLANHTVLIARNGEEYDISDSGAPIIDGKGNIFGVVLVFRDVTEEYLSRKEIEYLSWHDSLTGLKNRNYLEKIILNLQENNVKDIGIIMGDVNGLKITNDAFGHRFGDQLLREISTILKASTPEGSTIVRWGGDEFVLVLKEIDDDGLDRICSKIIKTCDDYVSKSPVKPSISLGHAVKTVEDQNLYRTLIRAEDMMYENKLLDKNSLRSVIVKSLETSLYEKSYETEEHAIRVAGYSEIIARKLELHANEINQVILLSKLHDIGKISIDDSVLHKRTKLNSDEWKDIKKHPETGYRIASSLNDLTHIAEGILCHHEHYDGNGYPRGIKGTDIPISARIVSIADAFDVMITDRVYKKTMTTSEAIEELVRCKGTQFDPTLVDVFVSELAKIL